MLVASTEWFRESLVCQAVSAGNPAGSHKKRTKLQDVGHDAATE